MFSFQIPPNLAYGNWFRTPLVNSQAKVLNGGNRQDTRPLLLTRGPLGSSGSNANRMVNGAKSGKGILGTSPVEKMVAENVSSGSNPLLVVNPLILLQGLEKI